MSVEQQAEAVAQAIIGTFDEVAHVTRALGCPGAENDSMFDAIFSRLASKCDWCGRWQGGPDDDGMGCGECDDEDWDDDDD